MYSGYAAINPYSFSEIDGSLLDHLTTVHISRIIDVQTQVLLGHHWSYVSISIRYPYSPSYNAQLIFNTHQ